MWWIIPLMMVLWLAAFFWSMVAMGSMWDQAFRAGDWRSVQLFSIAMVIGFIIYVAGFVGLCLLWN